MRLLLITILLSSILFISSCGTDCENLDPQYCKADEDCICESKGCFIGSKNYWNKCTDKSMGCLDKCPQDCNCVNSRCNCTNYVHT